MAATATAAYTPPRTPGRKNETPVESLVPYLSCMRSAPTKMVAAATARTVGAMSRCAQNHAGRSAAGMQPSRAPSSGFLFGRNAPRES